MTEDQETIATFLTSQIQPYPEADRKLDAQRLIKLVDAKKMLRQCAVNIDRETPGVWQLMVGNGLEFGGQALLSFTSGIKKLVKKAGIFDALSSLLFGIDGALEPFVRKFALFFGQKAAAASGVSLWSRVLDYFNPQKRVKGQYKAELLVAFMETLAAKKVAEMVDKACVGGVFVSRAERLKSHGVLKQKASSRRVRKTARSRKPGRKKRAR